MKNIRDKFENYFTSLGLIIYQYRYLSLLSVLALTTTLLLQLPLLSIDISNDAFYDPDDPIRVEYDEFRHRFGKDDHIYIGIKPDQVFDSAFLKQLQQLHHEIEEKIPYLKKVTSLINVRNTYGLDDELIVEDLIDPIPESHAQLEALKTKAMTNVFYQNYLLSADGKFTFIDIEPMAVTTNNAAEGDNLRYISTEEYSKMIDVLRPLLDNYNSPSFKTYIAGFPVITDKLTRAIEQSMAELTPITMVVNIIFLSILFRCLSGVIYPIIIVSITIVSTVGVMAWLSIPIDLVTTILPTLLTVVAIADSVHLLSGFYQEFQNNGGDKKAAIAHSMGRNGLAIFMTSITTAVGLASFLLADLAPVAHLGIAAPLGIILAFIYTIILLPALIAIFPISKTKADYSISTIGDQLLDWIADVTSRRYKGIISTSALLLIVGIVGATQLNISHNSLRWLPDDSIVKTDTTMIDKALGGSVAIEIVIDTGKKNGLYDPQLIKQLEASDNIIKNLGSEQIIIGKSNSLHTIIKEVNRALQANNNDFYRVPDSSNLIAQELLLFELSAAEDLHKLVDSDYSMVRFTIMVPFSDAIELKPVLDKIKTHFYSAYPETKVTVTGIGPMLVQTMYDVITTMFKSYGFALIAITCLMIVLIGKLKIGLLSMAPNLLPIVFVMGLMGWMGMPFDFSNMMVGSVAIGLVVDDTIHFLHNLRRHLDRTGNISIAISETLHTTGRAIFITSMVLISGMAVAMTADLKSTANFGLITGCTILLALAADFFLVPALMYATHVKKSRVQNTCKAVEQ